MSESSEIKGGCTCGAVRYQMTSMPMFVHCCHCRWCQRETGAAFALNALIEADRVEILQGQVERVETPTQSGKGQGIVRCVVCHVALFSHYAYGRIGEAVRFVRVGTLDAPDLCPPDIHIFAASKQPWVELRGDVPVCEAYYDTKAEWPSASLERRAALAAAGT